ncbi:MAG: response regulator [Bacteroidales bacterium]|nr:response regulator [Bacteroidales bacterium]
MADKLIFFVDDEPMFINLLEYTFKCRNGYTIRTFNSGEECIAHMDVKPDLVVVDFFLQGDSQMTGLDVVKKIKEINPATLVVFLSGNDDDTVINEAKAVGVEKYILKNGYFIDNLVECVSEILPVNSTGPENI